MATSVKTVCCGKQANEETAFLDGFNREL